MSFTDIATVRKHLLGAIIEVKKVVSLPITLTGQNEYLLPDRNLSTFSEIVKWKYANHPSVDGPIELIEGKFVQLRDILLVPGSVVVTLNDRLESIFCEEKDYKICYTEGKILNIEHGNIPNHQLVYVYYEKYESFEEGADYSINYSEGIIERTQYSEIPDGATILIDYSVEKGGIEDEAIEQAVLEANDIVLRSLAPEYSLLSTDQGLKTSETMLALSIVARTFAAAVLATERSTDAYNRAREWLQLSELWEQQAWKILAPFTKPAAVRSPVTQ